MVPRARNIIGRINMKLEFKNMILKMELENEKEILGLLQLIAIAKQTPLHYNNTSSYNVLPTLEYADFIEKFNVFKIFKYALVD